LGITAQKTELESLTDISEMGKALIEIRELDGRRMIMKEPQGSYQRLIVESGVVIVFHEQTVRGELN
jgi:hypothetical protein